MDEQTGWLKGVMPGIGAGFFGHTIFGLSLAWFVSLQEGG